MKKLINYIKVTFAVTCLLLFCNTIVLIVVMGYIPYTWTLGGHSVEDSSVYGGAYYQATDSIRIILVEDKNYNEYHEFFVYECRKGEYIKTGAWTFASTHSSKYGMICYLKGKYYRWKRSQKPAKSLL